MAMVLAIVFGVIALVLIAFAVTALVLRRMATSRLSEAKRALEGQQVLEMTQRANCFGRQSQSMAQLRGNGILALTATELSFFMLYPKRDHRVGLSTVERVETSMWFKGKSVGKELLVVEFGDGRGGQDAFGYWVPDAPTWVEAVRSAATAAGAVLTVADKPPDPESEG